MVKVQIEVEIPDGHEIVGEPERQAGGGTPSGTEYAVFVVRTKVATPLEILGVPADWPEWLTCDWVAKDKNGRVYAYNGRRPTKESKRWHSYDGWWDITDILPIRIPGPFEQSLRKNPRRKK
jgi:hypothetical protein